MMSRLGTIQQLALSNVLQRLEAYAKTGLLVIRQEARWVEFYFHEGRLLCIGPVRTDFSLGEHLLQAGIISAQTLHEALSTIGNAPQNEMSIALTLMDLGRVGHEELRMWAAQKAIDLLRTLLSWSIGELYFDEDAMPPPDRLLIALSVTSLVSSATQQQTKSVMQERLPQSNQQPRETSVPLQYVDTSLMRPEMVLIPADLSALRTQNSQLQMTPNQWRLLTQVDGHVTLQIACQTLSMTPTEVCQLTAELMVKGLIQLNPPIPIRSFSPPREFISGDVSSSRPLPTSGPLIMDNHFYAAALQAI